jgi:5-methylcytosine-specific restriction endonuclease McrA
MNAPVLVLNANFEPVNVCNTRRAIGLILSGKADLVMNGRGYIQTVKQALPRPSVIRLEHMIHRPRLQIKLTRREVFRRDGFVCQYCGRHTGDLTDQCCGSLPGLQPPQRRPPVGRSPYAPS